MDNSNTTYSVDAYALCFKCHNPNSFAPETGSWRYHGKHIREYRASCSICHDPHGVNSTGSDHIALMNFDRRFVTPNGGVILYNPATKACTLVCHGEPHNNRVN